MGKANGPPKEEIRHMVRVVARVLATGIPTPFQWEGWVRHGLRAAMCLQGKSWPLSDATAAEIVRRALIALNVTRPPWLWGQREYMQDSVGTRVSFSHCLQCGTKLPEGRPKFCASSCGDKYRQAFQTAEVQEAARERALASLHRRRDAAAPRPCEACGAWFRSAKWDQRFCSRQCSGGRSVADKMNGKAHPWKANGKSNGIGGNGANGATHSSPIARTNGNGSAIGNARTESLRPTFEASAPPPAPN